jgi:hypothetical protein
LSFLVGRGPAGVGEEKPLLLPTTVKAASPPSRLELLRKERSNSLIRLFLNITTRKLQRLAQLFNNSLIVLFLRITTRSLQRLAQRLSQRLAQRWNIIIITLVEVVLIISLNGERNLTTA